jgi:hypothetical protein
MLALIRAAREEVDARRVRAIPEQMLAFQALWAGSMSSKTNFAEALDRT